MVGTGCEKFCTIWQQIRTFFFEKHACIQEHRTDTRLRTSIPAPLPRTNTTQLTSPYQTQNNNQAQRGHRIQPWSHLLRASSFPSSKLRRRDEDALEQPQACRSLRQQWLSVPPKVPQSKERGLRSGSGAAAGNTSRAEQACPPSPARRTGKEDKQQQTYNRRRRGRSSKEQPAAPCTPHWIQKPKSSNKSIHTHLAGTKQATSGTGTARGRPYSDEGTAPPPRRPHLET